MTTNLNEETHNSNRAATLSEDSPTAAKNPEPVRPVASPQPAPPPPASASTAKVLLIGISLGIFTALFTLWFAPILREWMFAILPESKFAMQLRTTGIKELQKETLLLQKRITALQKKQAQITPRQPYLIVNTSENRIQIMKGDEQLHEGVCSTGSYVLLRSTEQQKQWMFTTPRGMFQILGKREAPVWKKPDWAFVEEGLPIPSANSPLRFEYGVLGEYALELGDGYLIHGTLYKRMLGMPVTHGCVRLGDDDLRLVYKNLQIGSKVFIY